MKEWTPEEIKYAGARSLLVTQWSVESSSARMLVQAIFSKIKEGVPKTKALALAKREFIEGGNLIALGPALKASLAHPFFWDPYVLVGETRELKQLPWNRFPFLRLPHSVAFIQCIGRLGRHERDHPHRRRQGTHAYHE